MLNANPQAIGIYRSSLFPILKDKKAELIRHSDGWVRGKFLFDQGPLKVVPTREELGFDATRFWIIYHEDDFDIIEGELGTPDCKHGRFDAPRDGAVVQGEDVLHIGEEGVFIGTRPVQVTDDIYALMKNGKLSVSIGRPQYAVGKVVHIGPTPMTYTRGHVAVIAAAWFVTGLCSGIGIVWWALR